MKPYVYKQCGIWIMKWNGQIWGYITWKGAMDGARNLLLSPRYREVGIYAIPKSSACR